MSNTSVLLIAETLVTIALLTWAAIDLVVNPNIADHPTAITIIGVVLGYWLGAAKTAVVNSREGK